MGVAREQKLVIKNSFLEYVCDKQAPQNFKPLRQRSMTEPGMDLDPIYEEVKDLFRGSDSSCSESEEHEDIEPQCIEVKRRLMHATPEFSPQCYPSHHISLPMYESWKETMPAAAMSVPEYAAWPDRCTTQNIEESWWGPMPFENQMAWYGQALPDQDQFHANCAGLPNFNMTEMKIPATSAMPSHMNEVQNEVKETRSSVMLRGVPETFTRPAMLQLLGTAGFFGRFNFLYLPMDFKRNLNLGYALINVVSPKEALRLSAYFEGFSSWDVPGGSVCSVAWCSPQQGLQAHLDRYKNSPVMHESVPEEWRPLHLMHGIPVAFPAPTTKIKAPKLKGSFAPMNQ